MLETVGIGIQDFEEIHKKNNFYVDKTLFIKEWWETNDKVTLVTRSRRFGKTLTQIEQKDYDAELIARGIEKSKIHHYGFAFSSSSGVGSGIGTSNLPMNFR